MDNIDKIIKNKVNDFVVELKAETLLGISRIDETSINRILSHGSNGFAIVSAYRGEIHHDNPSVDITNDYIKYLQEKQLEDTEKSRNEFLEIRNKKCDRECKEILRKSKFTYTATFGGYKDKETGNETFEPSYIVYNYTKNGEKLDFKELYDFATKLGDKFNQESIYIQKPGEEPHYVDPRTNEIMDKSSSLDFIVNDTTQPYFTTSKRKKHNAKRFSAPLSFTEQLFKKNCGSIFERKLHMEKYGEIFI